MVGLLRSHLGRRLAARRQTGQAVVELSLLLVLMIPLLVGSVDLGRAYFDYDLLAHAVNEGARRASFDRDTADIVAATQAASGRLNVAAANVTVTCYAGATTTTKTCASVVLNDVIQVTATAAFTPITPFITRIMPAGGLTIGASSRRTYQ